MGMVTIPYMVTAIDSTLSRQLCTINLAVCLGKISNSLLYSYGHFTVHLWVIWDSKSFKYPVIGKIQIVYAILLVAKHFWEGITSESEVLFH